MTNEWRIQQNEEKYSRRFLRESVQFFSQKSQKFSINIQMKFYRLAKFSRRIASFLQWVIDEIL